MWAILFKFAALTYPVVLTALFTWGAWITASQYKDEAFRNSGERFTKADAMQLEMRVNDKFATMQPQDVRDNMKALNLVNNEILARLTRMEARMEVQAK